MQPGAGPPDEKGAAMPFAQIYMLEGRTADQKKAVIEKVTQALQEATGAKVETIRVWIHEMPKENWGIAGVSAKDLGR
jgi:4-oxalocrotonate tautomerase